MLFILDVYLYSNIPQALRFDFVISNLIVCIAAVLCFSSLFMVFILHAVFLLFFSLPLLPTGPRLVNCCKGQLGP